MSPGGDATGRFEVLRKAVRPDHLLPRDLLAGARPVLE